MAGIGAFLLLFLCLYSANASTIPGYSAKQDAFFGKKFENILKRVDRFEEMLVERDRKIEALEKKLVARDTKINQLEERLTYHDHYIEQLRTKANIHVTTNKSNGETVHTDSETDMNSVRNSNGAKADNESINKHVEDLIDTEDAVELEERRKKNSDLQAANDATMPARQPTVPLESNSMKEHVPDIAVNTRDRRAGIDTEVAFFSKLANTMTHIGTNQAITFEQVVTNIGNGYNRYSGTFIAPVAGTYVFSITLVAHEHQSSDYQIFMNDIAMTNIYANGGDNTYDSTSQTVIFQLSHGDVVTVRHIDSDGALQGSGYSLFSGFLLPRAHSNSPGNLVGK